MRVKIIYLDGSHVWLSSVKTFEPLSNNRVSITTYGNTPTINYHIRHIEASFDYMVGGEE